MPWPDAYADGRGQGENHVVILHGQKVCLTCFEPALCGATLALRAVPVAARVIGDLRLRARCTAQRVAAERDAAALFDGRHDLQLAEAQMPALMTPPSRPVGAEDIRDLQGGAFHGRLRCRRGAGLQWTDHLAQDLGGNVGVEGCRLKLLVAEQHLDHAYVHLLLKQMSGKAVP